MVSDVVYLITCQSCGDQYIGETGRPLCIRIKEHLDGMTRSRITTALSGHRRHNHCNISFEEGRVHCREQRTGSVPRPFRVLIYGIKRGDTLLTSAGTPILRGGLSHRS
ncbi:hypothetical protein Y032_0113g366 [Ancylostoma ceylanicum]|uniref:GIY-YIG domain-containing protein n=1 Tax=Ancylostoma ceylanicum TaxID=53326 RepID=A0A016TDE0_9BILA|nr:hypothetical protein Y032_0113g366 [Ancylostoma ceylanicum]